MSIYMCIYIYIYMHECAYMSACMDMDMCVCTLHTYTVHRSHMCTAPLGMLRVPRESPIGMWLGDTLATHLPAHPPEM